MQKCACTMASVQVLTCSCTKQMDSTHQCISKAADAVCKALGSADYLENNFRVMLARELRRELRRELKIQGYEIYEEVVIPYIIDHIPFGHGFADIVVVTPEGSIILELKTTKKDCKRQLDKYMKHWKYNKLNGGATINFVNDSVTTHFYTFSAN